jgi:hypothetical protein
VGRAKGAKAFSAEDERQLRELAVLGISWAEAAKRMGRSYYFVRKYKNRLKLEWTAPPPRPSTPGGRVWTALDEERMRYLADNGWSIGLAAVELDWSFNTIIRRSRATGLRWTRAGYHQSRKGPDLPRRLRIPSLKRDR